MHVIGPRATINITKCIITGRIVAVEQTPFSAALEEDWLAPVISSLTFAFGRGASSWGPLFFCGAPLFLAPPPQKKKVFESRVS